MTHAHRILGLLAAVLLLTSGLAQAEDKRLDSDAAGKVKSPSPTLHKVNPSVRPAAPTERTDAAAKIQPRPSRVSPADKRALIAAFKDVDPSKYRLQFDGGREVYGSAKVNMSDVKQVRKFTAPGEDKGWIVLVVEGDDVIYVFAVGSKLDSVVGAQKAANLRAIMAKYQAPQEVPEVQQPGLQQQTR